MVILVMIDEPREIFYGGTVAGPVFSDVGAWTLNNLHINPDVRMTSLEATLGNNRFSKPRSGLRLKMNITDIETIPDFRGRSMREVLTLGTSMGFEILLEGTGFAFEQSPAPGVPLKEKTTVRVRFRPLLS